MLLQSLPHNKITQVQFCHYLRNERYWCGLTRGMTRSQGLSGKDRFLHRYPPTNLSSQYQLWSIREKMRKGSKITLWWRGNRRPTTAQNPWLMSQTGAPVAQTCSCTHGHISTALVYERDWPLLLCPRRVLILFSACRVKNVYKHLTSSCNTTFNSNLNWKWNS